MSTVFEEMTGVGLSHTPLKMAPYIKQTGKPDPASAFHNMPDTDALSRLGKWEFPAQLLYARAFRGPDMSVAVSWSYYPTRRTFPGTTRTVWVCSFKNLRGVEVGRLDGLRLVSLTHRVFFKVLY